jgi:hypothetical protein
MTEENQEQSAFNFCAVAFLKSEIDRLMTVEYDDPSGRSAYEFARGTLHVLKGLIFLEPIKVTK